MRFHNEHEPERGVLCVFECRLKRWIADEFFVAYDEQPLLVEEAFVFLKFPSNELDALLLLERTLHHIELPLLQKVENLLQLFQHSLSVNHHHCRRALSDHYETVKGILLQAEFFAASFALALVVEIAGQAEALRQDKASSTEALARPPFIEAEQQETRKHYTSERVCGGFCLFMEF